MKKFICFCSFSLNSFFHPSSARTLLLNANEPEAVVILGGGIGSLTSAIYLGKGRTTPACIEGGSPGGLLTQSH